ncbi:hypothetical protein BWI93_11640 [Siphonobacter sp. BAB-5385]|nr:hypothetical protein BWI93_11640 [Siphonobacter sp. BAB-5385]
MPKYLIFHDRQQLERFMSSESDLLYDLIKHCPNDSTWERLPELLKGFMTVSETHIQVIVNDHSRDKLLEVIERNDLSEKIVH